MGDAPDIKCQGPFKFEKPFANLDLTLKQSIQSILRNLLCHEKTSVEQRQNLIPDRLLLGNPIRAIKQHLQGLKNWIATTGMDSRGSGTKSRDKNTGVDPALSMLLRTMQVKEV